LYDAYQYEIGDEPIEIPSNILKISPPFTMTSIYTVRPSSGEGLGSFSTVDILAGTLILSEVPLFTVREPRTDSDVVTAFSQLSVSEQKQYLDLYAVDVESQASGRVIDIFNSNAWQTGSRTSILLKAARFNHSCVPNATLAWNSRLSCITIHAVVTIPLGSQIYLCYVNPYQTRSSRSSKLSAYGFVCSCASCVSGAASEIRRARMVVLDARIRVARRQKWRSEAPREALELTRLLKAEGLVGDALGLAYHDAAAGWKKCGRPELALEQTYKELEVCIMCYGSNSPEVDASKKRVHDLEMELAAIAVNVTSGECGD
jgi:hypothetical protein